MNDMTPGSVLLALVLAVLIPALIIHFTLGRNGGHHLFKNMPKDKVKELPLAMMRSRIRNNLRGSFAMFVGLGVALSLYPLACKLGLPLNVFGLTDEQFVFSVTLGIGMLVIAGFTVLGRRRGN